jgi:hypothetical protein
MKKNNTPKGAVFGGRDSNPLGRRFTVQPLAIANYQGLRVNRWHNFRAAANEIITW